MILLATIDPRAVAEQAVSAVVDHLHSLAFGVAAEVRVGEAALSTLRVSVDWLTVYAQTGVLPGDWTDTGCVVDAVLETHGALYGSAAHGIQASGPVDVAADVDEDSEIGVAMIGAMARVHLAQGAPLRVRELAVLGGVSVRQTQHDAAEGRLELEGPTRGAGRRASAEEATRWLRERKVPGV